MAAIALSGAIKVLRRARLAWIETEIGYIQAYLEVAGANQGEAGGSKVAGRHLTEQRSDPSPRRGGCRLWVLNLKLGKGRSVGSRAPFTSLKTPKLAANEFAMEIDLIR